MKILALDNATGHWQAVVYVPTPPDGETFHLDRRYGSWRVTPPEGNSGHRDALPHIAAELQAEVRKRERKGSRASGGS